MNGFYGFHLNGFCGFHLNFQFHLNWFLTFRGQYLNPSIFIVKIAWQLARLPIGKYSNVSIGYNVHTHQRYLTWPGNSGWLNVTFTDLKLVNGYAYRSERTFYHKQGEGFPRNFCIRMANMELNMLHGGEIQVVNYFILVSTRAMNNKHRQMSKLLSLNAIDP